MHIVQIAPVIGPGSGIPGAALELGQALSRLGHTVENFTADDARGHPRRTFRRSFTYRLGRAWYALQFSIGGTRKARRFLAERPGAVSICLDGVMAGDIYVDHGVTAAAMVAHGDLGRRMLRNPLLGYIHVRDRIRYRGRTHRAVVALTDSEVDVLTRFYGKVTPPVAVIPHGVDLERFRPPDAEGRAAARARLNLDNEHRVALFIGHDFIGKGVALAIDALLHAPTLLLLVVGGHAEYVETMRAHARTQGVEERVLFLGPQRDLPEFFAAADVFVFPSEYESYGLVIAEALAAGVPVVSTPVGCAPELIVDGVNGYLTGRDAAEIGERLEQVAATDVDQWRERCRASVAHLTWTATAQAYVRLLTAVAPERVGGLA